MPIVAKSLGSEQGCVLTMNKQIQGCGDKTAQVLVWSEVEFVGVLGA